MKNIEPILSKIPRSDLLNNMNPSKWQVIKNLMSEALDLPAEQRAGFLASENDEEIRLEVENLLAANALAEDFIERPALIERGLAAETQMPDHLTGRLIENYLILERLGAGGMGTVYLAEKLNSDFKQRVAVKLVVGLLV